MTEPTPRTEAGRPIGKAKAALIARMTRSAETVFGPMPDDQFIRALDVIEAQARTEALAAEPPALDVERLTLALHQYRHGRGDGTLPPHCGCFVTAEGVAVEYTRLTREETP